MHKSNEHSTEDVNESMKEMKKAEEIEQETAIIWLDNTILECKVEELQKETLGLIRKIQESKGEINDKRQTNEDLHAIDSSENDSLGGDLVEELERVRCQNNVMLFRSKQIEMENEILTMTIDATNKNSKTCERENVELQKEIKIKKKLCSLCKYFDW